MTNRTPNYTKFKKNKNHGLIRTPNYTKFHHTPSSHILSFRSSGGAQLFMLN